MRNNHYIESEWLDLVFEGKNKSYGAFLLRRNYASNMNRALILGLFFFVFCSFVPGYFFKVPKEKVVSTCIDCFPWGWGVKVEKQQYKEKKIKIVYRKKPKYNRTRLIVPIVMEDRLIKHYDWKQILSINEIETNFIDESIDTVSYTKSTKLISHSTSTDAIFVDGAKESVRLWIGNCIKLPKKVLHTSLHGKIIVSFIVDENGFVTNPEIWKDEIGDRCAKAVLSSIQKMPKWKPAIRDGKPCKQRILYPITFEYKKTVLDNFGMHQF